MSVEFCTKKNKTPYLFLERGFILSRAVNSVIDFGYFLDPVVSFLVRHFYDLVSIPVKVVCDKGYLLEHTLQGVAYDSPRRPNSFSKVSPQCGHFTSIVTSSSFIRLYISSKNLKSEAKRFSITPVLISFKDPS